MEIEIKVMKTDDTTKVEFPDGRVIDLHEATGRHQEYRRLTREVMKVVLPERGYEMWEEEYTKAFVLGRIIKDIGG